MPAFAFTVGSLGDILATAGLAAEIAKALYDTGAVANECKALTLELQSLQNVLILTQYALQHYHLTPIGETLANFIRPEVAQCHSSLQSFMEKLDACRQALLSTVITSFWRKVVWAASSEVASFNTKLSNHRGKLTMLLVSLNCVGLMDFGTEIRQVYARISDVHAYLRM